MNALALAGLLVPAAPALAPVDPGTNAPADTDAHVAISVALTEDGLFPAATEDLALAWPDGSEGLTLLDVVHAYGAVTGQRLAMRADTINTLRSTRAPIDRPTSVPATEVQGFVEAMLRAEDVMITIDRAAEPRLIGVHSLQTAYRNGIRSRAQAVDSDDVELMRRHPAMLFQTVVDLPNVDVRQMSNSMRTLIVDANTQQMLPAGNEHSMVVIGYGPMVADMVEQLRAIDAASAEAKVSVAHALIRLENADAATAAPIVEAALTTSRELRARPVYGGHPQQRPPVLLSVIADARLNALLVTCRSEDMDEAREVVAQIDAK